MVDLHKKGYCTMDNISDEDWFYDDSNNEASCNPIVTVNLTKHEITEEQEYFFVVNPSQRDISKVRELLSFDVAPSEKEMNERATILANIAMATALSISSSRTVFAWIDAEAFFINNIAQALLDVGITPVYAFNRRGKFVKFITKP